MGRWNLLASLKATTFKYWGIPNFASRPSKSPKTLAPYQRTQSEAPLLSWVNVSWVSWNIQCSSQTFVRLVLGNAVFPCMKRMLQWRELLSFVETYHHKPFVPVAPYGRLRVSQKRQRATVVPVPPQSPLHSFFHCDMAMGLDGNVDMVIHIFHLSNDNCHRVGSPLCQLDSIPAKFTGHSHSHPARLLYFDRSGNLCHHRYVHMFLHRNMEDLILRLEPKML